MVGNVSNFTVIDILRCILRFNRKTGRQKLTRELELGEGTVRTILNMLKSKKLLDSTKKGHFLSKKGNELLIRITKNISLPKNLEAQGIYPNLKKVGVVIRNAPNIREVYKLRDIAVRNGAEGAIILKFEDGLYAPDADFKQDYGELEECFDFKRNDVLVVAFSSKRKSAENGALAVAVELSDIIKEILSQFQQEAE